jgi:hypothetical protein
MLSKCTVNSLLGDIHLKKTYYAYLELTFQRGVLICSFTVGMIVVLYMAALFVVLTPGVLVRFPKNCSKLIVAATHAAIFVGIFWLTQRFVMRLAQEGFQDTPDRVARMMPEVESGPIPVIPPPPSAARAAAAAQGPMPTSAPSVKSPSSSSNLAAMNIMISTGSGKSGHACANGNDCASGMCMGGNCV